MNRMDNGIKMDKTVHWNVYIYKSIMQFPDLILFFQSQQEVGYNFTVAEQVGQLIEPQSESRSAALTPQHTVNIFQLFYYSYTFTDIFKQ